MQALPKRSDARVATLALSLDRAAGRPIAISETAARLLGAITVLAIGLIHILDAAGTYHTTRWIFWAYIALIVASVPVALLLLHLASPLAWAAAAALAAGPFVGYLWSRSVGLPGDAPDVGNWLCTLGMAALFVEVALLGLSATRLVLAQQRPRPRGAAGTRTRRTFPHNP
jgi:hypothetical protein